MNESETNDELSALRIRQVTMLRRATYRARSYVIIGGTVLAVAALELVVQMIGEIRTAGWQLRLIAFALAVIVALLGAIFCFRRAIVLTGEIRRHDVPAPPTTSPDFSTLGDGSNLADKLNQIQ